MSETAWVVAGALILIALDVASLINRASRLSDRTIWGHSIAYGAGAALVAAWMVQRAGDGGALVPIGVALAAGVVCCLGSALQLKRARALRERLSGAGKDD